MMSLQRAQVHQIVLHQQNLNVQRIQGKAQTAGRKQGQA
uniref:Uncharacterized protein n=1 Tax=Arundo donax TaxID=35708 RepID=A0A0A9A8Q1_ARUDO